MQRMHGLSLFLSIHCVYLFFLFLRDGMHVAVKIVKNVGRYREAARSEIQVLEHLNSTDPNSVL